VILAIALVTGIGVLAGFLLQVRIPPLPLATKPATEPVSVIVPARNEEQNLPRLLGSLPLSAAVEDPRRSALGEVIVVNDHSSDNTAEIAASYGARVLNARALPSGWTGKTWACAQGAEAATANWFLFLDADTGFESGGFERLAAAAREHQALSLAPYHRTSEPYEELSLFFHLLMVFGAGGFGAFGKARLFGQCMILPRQLYRKIGGHEAVRGCILENFLLADLIANAGGTCRCASGQGVLSIRMFPEGFPQLYESWTKAFADGAAGTDGSVLALTILWLGSMSSMLLFLILGGTTLLPYPALCYLIFAAQIFFFARQIGSYRLFTSLAYPVPLLFFFALFGGALVRKQRKQRSAWRGREV